MKKIHMGPVPEDHTGRPFLLCPQLHTSEFLPGSEAVFLKILRDDLGVDVFDDAKHTSCTGIGYHSDIVPLETIMTVVARQFALMTEAGYENMVSSCITSFGLYTEILTMWEHHPELEEQARPISRLLRVGISSSPSAWYTAPISYFIFEA